VTQRTRANYALVDVGEHLGEDRKELDVLWADFVGDRSTEHTFSVPTETTIDPSVGVQAFDVGAYGHEIYVNDEPLSGFDVPPAEGWQYWVDRITGAALREGENSFHVARDMGTDDGSMIGTAWIHWKEPLD
jgi:hypothetical protein